VLVGRGGAAGIDPGSEPVGAHIGGGVGELADERGGGLVVQAVEVFVVVGLGVEVGVAVRQQDIFQPAMGAQAGFEGVVSGVVDVRSVAGAHREERREAIDQSGAEALVDSSLPGKVTVKIFRGVEGIVGLGDIVGQNRGIDLGLVPVAELQGLRELLAVDANLPGKEPGGFEFGLTELGHGGLVASGQGGKGEAAVPIEIEKVIAALRGSSCERVQRVGNVQHERGAIDFKEAANVYGQSVDGLVDDELMSVATPGKEGFGGRRGDRDDGDKGHGASVQ